MPIDSKAKGRRAEYAAIDLLRPVIEKVRPDLLLKRNLTQTRGGGYDLDGIDWLALEVKHHQTPQLEAWWRQALRQAKDGQEPVLLWKTNYKPWRVRMFGHLPGQATRHVVDVSVGAFLVWLEEQLRRQL